MSSLAWRINRLRAMRPKEIAFRVHQALAKRQEMRRAPSEVAQQAEKALADFPIPETTRPIRFFDFEYPFPEITPEWHKDLKTGIVAPLLRWPEIDYRDVKSVGNAKNIWELNRHGFLEDWAKESSDDTAIAVARIMLSWIAENPRPMGINWSSSLEPAFRMIAWQKALDTLGNRESLQSVRSIIEASVTEQCDHIMRFPSLYSSANNHRIGELTGALAGAAILGGAPWAEPALRDLKEELQLQVTADGVDREQAIFYHDYVLGFAQRAQSYARAVGKGDDAFFQQIIDKMRAYSNWMRHAPGRWFEIGDRDDGIPPLDEGEPEGVRQGIGFWQEGGYAIWHSGEASACFRSGKFGYPSIAAHAHCDQLSVLLVANGYEIFTDSGTYCYHEDEAMRRYFKGTSAHNTIRVDGVDQAEYGGPFLWSTHADGEIARLGESEFEGLHRGYQRLPGGVIHKRRVAFGGGRLLSVADTIEAQGNHDYELFWNLGPDCSVSTLGDGGIEITAGNKKYRMEIESDRERSIEIAEGKYSRKFGEMQSIQKIVVKASGAGWTVTTTIEAAD